MSWRIMEEARNLILDMSRGEITSAASRAVIWSMIG